MKIKILMRRPNFPDRFLKRLQNLGNLEIAVADKLSEEEAGDCLQDVDLLICAMSWFSHIGKVTLDKAKQLRYIGVYWVGVDWIDVKYAQEKGITICTTNGTNAQSVAEHIRGMILNLSKKISLAERQVRNNDGSKSPNLEGIEIYQKTIGIIGLGRIGTRVAQIATGFWMNILGYTRTPKNLGGGSVVDLDTLLKQSDIITLCLSLTSETENLISFSEIEKMKNSVILINCARESLVDKEALFKGIEEGKIFWYGVDTDSFLGQPITEEYFNYPQIVITPHNARRTVEANEKTLKIICENAEAFLEGEPINVVA